MLGDESPTQTTAGIEALNQEEQAQTPHQKDQAAPFKRTLRLSSRALVDVARRHTKAAFLIISVAASYTIAARIVAYIQVTCDYHSGATITYLNQIVLGCASIVGFFVARVPQEGLTRKELFWMRLRTQGRWAALLAPLYWLCNTAFIVAQRWSSVGSAQAFEQMAVLFIAGLSGHFLRLKYNKGLWASLIVAVVGAMLALWTGHIHGSYPLVGHVLSVAIAFAAALYMVLFKYAFGRDETMMFHDVMFFIGLRAAIAVLSGWIVIVAFDGVGVDMFEVPSGETALWILVGAVFSGAFTVLLSLATLWLSPLVARLAMMLAIPCSFMWDLLVNGGNLPITNADGTFLSLQFLGVVMICVGLMGFEYMAKLGSLAVHDSSYKSASSLGEHA